MVLLVNAEDDLEAVGEVASEAEAVAAARALEPDVVVLASSLLRNGGSDTVEGLLREHEGLRVVVLSIQDDPRHARAAFDRGASGYVLEQAPEAELVPAIREVAAGGRYVHPELGARLIAAEQRRVDDPLSDREREVLRLLAFGHTNQEIAGKLFISVRTVEAHRTHIMQKLRLSTRAELVRHALDEGLLAK